jgi:hypothetical protein
MIGLAGNFGWLSSADQRAEVTRMIGDQLAGDRVGSADVDLVCALNRDHGFDPELDRVRPRVAAAQAGSVSHAALLACMGSTEARARVLRGLTSANDDEVQIAQIYLQHRPITDATELRDVAAEIARMNASDAQARALDTLARYQLSDREILETLTRLYPRAKSVNVQRAIAGILIRADYQMLAGPELARSLREHRIKSSGGEDMIDVLIRRLAS